MLERPELVDSLSDVLNRTRFKGTVYCVSEFTAPWGLRMPGHEGHAAFLVVLRGGCLISVDGSRESISLSGGELLMLPHGAGYAIQDRPSSRLTPIEKIMAGPPARGEIVRFGGGGALTSLMMGCFEFDTRTKNPLIESLPGAIYLKAQHLQSEPWLDTMLRMLASEGTQNRPGADTLICRLTDLIFIQIIRAYITQIKNCTETPSWLKALADDQIGAALNLIHEKPDAPWTVASLASAVGLSRTSFAVKFTALVANSPMGYLTSWRMQQAVALMESGEENMSRLARLVGYTSEAAFAKAFKREIGEAPGAFKRNMRGATQRPNVVGAASAARH